jgi:hypothetical protein
MSCSLRNRHWGVIFWSDAETGDQRKSTSLTTEQLQEAAKTIADGLPINNPTILGLLLDLPTIGTEVPQSFPQAENAFQDQRHGYGMPAFWITINPSDLRNPLSYIWQSLNSVAMRSLLLQLPSAVR